MKRFDWPLITVAVLVLILSGCADSPVAPSAAQTASQIDVTRLAANLDVAVVKALQGRADVVILDVRQQSEYDAGHIASAKLIPLGSVPNRLNEIPKDKPVIITCRSGNRSAQAADYLRKQGYTNVHNMLGGIKAWQQAGYPVER